MVWIFAYMLEVSTNPYHLPIDEVVPSLISSSLMSFYALDELRSSYEVGVPMKDPLASTCL